MYHWGKYLEIMTKPSFNNNKTFPQNEMVPHNFPIIILPLVNCLADFIVYGFIHPTIRHEVTNLMSEVITKLKTLMTCNRGGTTY